jgi:DNA-binding IclR family transcriptional regulator
MLYAIYMYEIENGETAKPKVNSVAKCLQILDCFSPQVTELNLTQISQALKIPKSTLLSMIRTLEGSGYLYKANNSQNYRLGFKLMELSYNARATLRVVQYAIPFMEELQLHTGEIVYLTTHIYGRVLYLECMYPAKRAIAYSIYGKTLPMHCTGCGKAMLTFMPEGELNAIISKWGLPRSTPNTITDLAKLKKALAKYRELGYAIDNEEESHNVRCIAMPIRSSGGAVAGAISVSGHPMTMTDEKFPEYARLLAGACNFLSQYADLFPSMLIRKNPGEKPVQPLPR